LFFSELSGGSEKSKNLIHSLRAVPRKYLIKKDDRYRRLRGEEIVKRHISAR
jgi:hypothetical protein